MTDKYIYNPPLETIVLSETIGFDTEFNSLDTKHAKLICFSITNEYGQTYVCETLRYNKDALQTFFRCMAGLKKVLCHHTKVEIGVIYSNVNVLLRNCWCTMLASQIIDNGYGYKVKKELLEEEGFKLPEGHDGSAVFYTENMVGHIKYSQRPHSLIGCVRRYLGIELIEQKEKKAIQGTFITYDFKTPLTKHQLDYAAEDTLYLIPLHKAQLPYIAQRELGQIVSLENTLTPVLVKMEHRGCRIDVVLHRQNIKKWQNTLEEITDQLDAMLLSMQNKFPAMGNLNFNRSQMTISQGDMFGAALEIKVGGSEAFNYSSTKQLNELFVACGQKLPMSEDDKVSFGEESLAFYTTNNPESDFVQFLNLLLKYREYEKLLGTYSGKLINNLDGDRIRTSYSQCFAETGRLTSSEVISGEVGLNLANIPKNPDIRKVFVPDEGFVFIDSDMTGQELVLAGDYAQDPVLIKAFRDGFDHHSFLASISYSIIFGEPVEIKNKSEIITVGKFQYDVKKLRDIHKNCLFSKVYLGGPKRIQALLNEYLVNHVEPEKRFATCKEISNALDAKLKKLITYLKGIVATTQQQGYAVANKMGRRRYFDNSYDVYGNAANMPIQGSGADAIKIAMINIDKFFVTKSAELGIPEEEFGYLTLSVYDQVLCNLNKKYIEYKEEVPKAMAKALSYFLTTLKGNSDLNVREFWGK